MAKNFDEALVECLSHLRDVSLRDGIQSWDGNKWPIGTIIPVLKEIDHLALLAKNHGGKFAPVEIWGGGQFAQPAKFLKEDPLINLEEIRQAAPNLDLQLLYRGRQGLGFIPVSKEVQKAALEATVKRGINVIRIFDMMNDMENLEPGIRAMAALKKVHHDKPFLIEGAISYISEPEGGQRAWTLEEYGDLAVKMAHAGCDEIAIKNYSGVGDKEMPDLVRMIHKKLADAGLPKMKVNLHTHGQKPDVLIEAMGAGADKVDVAFGQLSGGPSHSNIIDTLKLMLKKEGFDVDGEYKQPFNDHEIVRQMRCVENIIAAQLKTMEYDHKLVKNERGKPLTQEQMDKYRMAGGAFGDLWKNYIKDDAMFASFVADWKRRRATIKDPQYGPDEFGDRPPVPKSKLEWRDAVLELGTKLWEKAGRFNTVTPGAFILCWQAVLLTNKRLGGEKIAMTDFTQQYIDVIIGRYGKNQGIEKGIGDLKFRDAALIFRALKALNESIAAGKVTKGDAMLFFSRTLPGITLDPKGMVYLDSPQLKEQLEQTDIQRFRKESNFGMLPAEVRETMIREMTPGRSPEPKEGLAEGRKIMNGMFKSVQEKNSTFSAGNRISNEEDAALLTLLLRQRTPDGRIDDSIAYNLFATQRTAAHKRATAELLSTDAGDKDLIPRQPDVPVAPHLVQRSKHPRPSAVEVGRTLLFPDGPTPNFPPKDRMPN